MLRSRRKRSRHKIQKRRFKKNAFIISFCIALFLMSVAYAAYRTGLGTSNIAKVYQSTTMHISSVNLNESTTGYEEYDMIFDSDSITVNVNLPLLSSIVVYDVVIKNNSDVTMDITDIFSEYYDNEDIVFETVGINIGDAIIPGSSKTGTLIIRYDSGINMLPSNTIYSAIIQFVWEEHDDDILVANINYSKTNWTNEDVIASVVFNQPDIIITNNNGSNQYVFDSNDTFTFAYLNNLGLPQTIEAIVTWIDKLPPASFVPSVSLITDTSISLGGSTTDTGGSGIDENTGYYYSSDDGHSWFGPHGTSYTITGLMPDTAYTLKMKAVDNAGNETESYAVLTRTTDSNSTTLPIIVNPDEDGQYFTFTNFPAGINYVGDHYDGDTFTFVLAKPQSVSNSGNNTFSFTLPITNGSSYQWTAGLVGAAIGGGVFNKVEPTLSATTVNSGASVNVVHSIMSKIDVSTTDDVRVTISFMVNGVRRELFVDFWWIPYDSYAVFFNSNGADGSMKAKICKSAATCTLSAHEYTNSGKTFMGWAMTPEGEVVYTNSAIIPAGTYPISSKVVLYAIWN